MEKKHSFTWKQAYRSIDALIALLHFACLKRVKSTGVTFENVDHTFAVGRKRYPKKIEVFNAGIAAPLNKNLHENDFVFMFHDIETRFTRFCADWLQFCIEQREALACYDFTVSFSLPDGLRLTSITQALANCSISPTSFSICWHWTLQLLPIRATTIRIIIHRFATEVR